jgi:hypothetical protein
MGKLIQLNVEVFYERRQRRIENCEVKLEIKTERFVICGFMANPFYKMVKHESKLTNFKF